jgi:hypothetical protein
MICLGRIDGTRLSPDSPCISPCISFKYYVVADIVSALFLFVPKLLDPQICGYPSASSDTPDTLLAIVM